MGPRASLQVLEKRKNECWEWNDNSDCGSDDRFSKHMTEPVLSPHDKKNSNLITLWQYDALLFFIWYARVTKIQFAVLARIWTAAAAPQSYLNEKSNTLHEFYFATDFCSSFWQTKISYLPWMYEAEVDIISGYMDLTQKGSCISTWTWIMTSAWTGHGYLLSLWRTQQICSTNSKIWCFAWPTGTSTHSPHQGLLFLPPYLANIYSVLVFIYFYFYIYTLFLV